MLPLVVACPSLVAPLVAPRVAVAPRTAVVMEEVEDAPAPVAVAASAAAFGMDDLAGLARAQNPIVGFWDPLGVAGKLAFDSWPMAEDTGAEGGIAFLRHAEIKHGRVAMAGFVGYLIHENGVRWPFALSGTDWWSLQQAGPDYSAYEGLSAPDVWDALPDLTKMQIVFGVGALELYGELASSLDANGEKHYMRGGKPGYYPGLDHVRGPSGRRMFPLDLWDPFGFTKKLTEEQKATKLVAEVNNGRLAMLGLMGLISSSKGLIVPGLDTLGFKSYAGEVMQPFGDSVGTWAALGY